MHQWNKLLSRNALYNLLSKIKNYIRKNRFDPFRLGSMSTRL